MCVNVLHVAVLFLLHFDHYFIKKTHNFPVFAELKNPGELHQYLAIFYIVGYNARGLRTLLSFPASALIRGSQYTATTSYPACDTTQPALVGGARRRPGKLRPPPNAPRAHRYCTREQRERSCLRRRMLLRCRLCLLACSVMLDQ